MEMSRFKYLFVVGVILQLLTLWFDVGTTSCELAVAPLALGLMAAAGGSAIGDILNNRNKANAEYSMELQKELMDYEYKNFSSPAAQVKSMTEAGLNPAVVFGQGGMRGASPSMSAPQVEQIDSNPVQSILTLAEAAKAGSEAAGNALDNEVKRKTMDDVIAAAGKANKWTDEKINLAQQQAYNLQGINTKVQEEVNNLRKEGVRLDFENENWKKRFDAEMRSYADKHNLDSKQYAMMVEQAPYVLDKLKHEASILSVEDSIQGDYADFNAKLGVIGKILGFVSEFIKKR